MFPSSKYKGHYLIIFIIIVFVVSLRGASAEEYLILENKHVKILFENLLRPAAEELADIYPEIKSSLQKNMAWDLNLRPTVVLIRNRHHFQNFGVHPLTVGFAVPKSSMIIIDYTKMSRRPFSLENTLKHEMCHLLLHLHIPNQSLPKWLNEGVCQWVSGIENVIMDQNRSLLNKASFSGSFIPLKSLEISFPADNDLMLLAYEESKSFVEFTISRYGKEGLLRILAHLKDGESIEQAFKNSISSSFSTLERQWHESLKKNTIWYAYISYYLYEIIFGILAFISIFGFIKIIKKKKAYMTEYHDDVLPP